MQRTMLKSKIHRASVTEKSLAYEGSISLGPELLAAADILQGEQVQVVNVENGERFITYAMIGKPQQVCLNGAAARLGEVGDRVIIMTFTAMEDAEARAHKPQVVLVDGQNRISAKH